MIECTRNKSDKEKEVKAVILERQSLLEELLDCFSPSGFEENIQKIIWREMSSVADVSIDSMGNVAGIRNPGGSKKVILAAHCDEVGLVVQYISEDGFLYVRRIGGLNPRVALGQRVMVLSKNARIPGIVGCLSPVNDEEKKPDEISQLWVDIGAKDKEEVEGYICVGDPIVPIQSVHFTGENRVLARSLDDKVGCFIIMEALRRISRWDSGIAVIALSSVQEEIGSRGVGVATFRLKPDIGIVVDVISATDHPGADKKLEGDVVLGKGPVLRRGPNTNPILLEELIAVAKRSCLPFQLFADAEGTRTDAASMQMNREGVITGLVNIPLRYMHSPGEIVALKDIETAIQLLATWIESLEFTTSYTPRMSS